MIKEVGKRVSHSKRVHHIAHLAHSLEHPAHLIYFGMLATHMNYKMAAIGCLVIGFFAMLPSGGHAEEADAEEIISLIEDEV